MNPPQPIVSAAKTGGRLRRSIQAVKTLFLYSEHA
jgi:hypothetical protein